MFFDFNRFCALFREAMGQPTLVGNWLTAGGSDVPARLRMPLLFKINGSEHPPYVGHFFVCDYKVNQYLSERTFACRL